MERIPQLLKERLIAAGYDSIDSLPVTPDPSHWRFVKQDLGFTNPDLNRVIRAVCDGSGVTTAPTAPLGLSFSNF